MMWKRVMFAIATLSLFSCAVDDDASSSDIAGLTTDQGGVHTANQAKQVVIEIFETLGSGDLEGYLAGLTEDVRWNVNAQFLPWGGERIGRDAVRAFFVQVLSVVAVTSFATVPDESIAQRVDRCEFTVMLATEERVISLRDPNQTVDIRFRYITTVGCDGKISAIDIFDDSGAVEHMLRRAGDLP